MRDFRWLNGAPLNDTRSGETVSFLESIETPPDG